MSMFTVLSSVTDLSGTCHSASFKVADQCQISLPSAVGEATLDLDGAVGYVQYLSPEGEWIDYADGADGEQFTAAGNKLVVAEGLELRVEFREGDGGLDIPAVYVSGGARRGDFAASH